jgi:hypothetical protein
MDWIRYQLGVSASIPETRKPNAALERHVRDASSVSHAERAAKFARAQAMKIDMLEADLNEAKDEVRDAVKRRDRSAAGIAVAKERKLAAELGNLRAKQANLEQTRNAIGNANANLAQGVLFDQGASELTDVVEAMNQIDLAAAAHKMRDAAQKSQYHDSLLTQPIFGETNAEWEQHLADIELDRIMTEADERNAAIALGELPNVPTESVGTQEGGKETPVLGTPMAKSN